MSRHERYAAMVARHAVERELMRLYRHGMTSWLKAPDSDAKTLWEAHLDEMCTRINELAHQTEGRP